MNLLAVCLCKHKTAYLWIKTAYIYLSMQFLIKNISYIKIEVISYFMKMIVNIRGIELLLLKELAKSA